VKLLFTPEAEANLAALRRGGSKAKVLKAVLKTLGLMETNLGHPSLKTHKYSSLKGPGGEDVFEAYAQNRTPGAYCVFWIYGPRRTKSRSLPSRRTHKSRRHPSP
jgi:hypothetical protein